MEARIFQTDFQSNGPVVRINIFLSHTAMDSKRIRLNTGTVSAQDLFVCSPYLPVVHLMQQAFAGSCVTHLKDLESVHAAHDRIRSNKTDSK